MMSDIIRLLPDSVANQIAAGEVIQRPASALKEVLENCIDAGSSDIKVIIKDSGKTLIQVIDDGCGMSEKDASLSFERHATSKIHSAKDLFAIKTLGFRGEALASIGAVAQVELKTKRKEDELATCIQIEGSKVKKAEACQSQNGTNISIKNLFFNTPARRNFLKSNAAELRHIVEEFQRVALVNPDISMSIFHNNKPLLQLNSGSLIERIVAIFGKQYKERLIPVEQKTSEITITGFIGKPQYAKKTRGEQFFFTNNRFIKHPYLHHAIDNAFQELLPQDSFPTYFIYFDIDPQRIDVNIHPTKTEINFQDNQLIYAILRSTIRQALGKFNITPTIDFDQEQSIDLTYFRDKNKPVTNPFLKKDSGYNPFEQSHSSLRNKSNRSEWTELYKSIEGKKTETRSNDIDNSLIPDDSHENSLENKILFQLKNKYIITQVKSGLLLVDQHKAHERILYEKYLKRLEEKKSLSQQELFPQNITLSPSDADILIELEENLKILGFNINQLSQNTFVINGSPAGTKIENTQEFIEDMLESYKSNLVNLNLEQKTNIARAMASKVAVQAGTSLNPEEMAGLINDLFSCQIPEYSPGGQRIVKIIRIVDIDELFKK